jgi:glucose-1-phosphate thymidylyltransferase
MRCLILAGGFATRLWPITERRAKPLLPLAGRPLLSHVVEAVPQDIEITVSTNAAFADDIKAWAKSIRGRRITVAIEDAGHEGQKLGALGAIALWIREQNLQEDLLLLAGDNYVAAPMDRFLAARGDAPLIAAHDVGEPERARQFGTIIVGTELSGRGTLPILSFEEKPEHPRSTFVSTGWWWLPKASLSVLTEYAAKHPDNVGGVFEEFLRRNMRVECFVFTELWKDIGSFESYLELHRSVLGDKTMIDPSASVKEGVQLEGSVALGPKTRVEASTLRDCILFGKTMIRDCMLERCIIDEGCTLEGVDLRDQMIRAGTVLRRA